MKKNIILFATFLFLSMFCSIRAQEFNPFLFDYPSGCNTPPCIGTLTNQSVTYNSSIVVGCQITVNYSLCVTACCGFYFQLNSVTTAATSGIPCFNFTGLTYTQRLIISDLVLDEAYIKAAEDGIRQYMGAQSTVNQAAFYNNHDCSDTSINFNNDVHFYRGSCRQTLVVEHIIGYDVATGQPIKTYSFSERTCVNEICCKYNLKYCFDNSVNPPRFVYRGMEATIENPSGEPEDCEPHTFNPSVNESIYFQSNCEVYCQFPN